METTAEVFVCLRVCLRVCICVSVSLWPSVSLSLILFLSVCVSDVAAVQTARCGWSTDVGIPPWKLLQPPEAATGNWGRGGGGEHRCWNDEGNSRGKCGNNSRGACLPVCPCVICLSLFVCLFLSVSVSLFPPSLLSVCVSLCLYLSLRFCLYECQASLLPRQRGVAGKQMRALPLEAAVAS